MPKAKLFEENEDSDDSGDAEELSLKVNEDYAKKYEKWRAGEELQKLRDKYGPDADFEDGDSGASDSESSSSSEEEPELLAQDKDWLRTLAMIKAKDSRIYDPKFSFYAKPSEEDALKKQGDKKDKKKEKAESESMFLRDYERKMILEAEGKPIDDDENATGRRIVDDEAPFAYNEEQRKLKESFKQFLEDDDEEDEPLLTKKAKTSEEMTAEEAAYLQWLKGQPSVEVDPEEAKDLGPLRKYWNDPKLPENERFLRDFILTGKVEDGSNPAERAQLDDGVDLEADEAEVEKQDHFEHKYNFRFEEPDPEFIKSYPRTVNDSLRKKDDSRAKKREERKKRKQQEEVERREELRQLKRLKRNEIAEKLKKLKQIAGADGDEDDSLGAFKPEDLDGDYDPEAHAKMLERVFNDDYYNVAEDARPDVELNDEEFQEYVDEIKAEAGSDWEEDGEPVEEGESGEPGTSKEEPSQAESERPWRRKKSRVAMELAKEKPVFNPEEKTFDDYLDEYYKLDYEDVVGGLPCRFKYRKVEPVDFGLDAKEVLKARDKELNSWVSVKRVVQYRRPEDDLKDKRRYEQKAQNLHKKLKVLPSLAEQAEKKKPEQDTSAQLKDAKKKKNKKHNQGANQGPLIGFTDERAQAYGLDPRKFKYTKDRFIQQDANGAASSSNTNNKNKKSKKKPAKARPVFA